jgi:hypothetical protein
MDSLLIAKERIMPRSPLGDCCQNHDPRTAPVVYPHAVTIDRGSLRGEYQCKCGRTWSCWWDMRAAGWTAGDVESFAADLKAAS